MIHLIDVTKIYKQGEGPSVDRVCLTIKTGETIVLLGSSGAGKTTLLKMINRLVLPTHGCIKINDRDVKSYVVEELRRSIGYVFQSPGLFPHMTVEENITIVLRLMGRPLKERKERARELLEFIHLDPDTYSNRYPEELSGGEGQRVGVGRALAADPEFLLMDEAFGALDAITREALQDEILHLKSVLKKTIVFVTHDINEAFKIGDRIAVMHQGKLEQVGTKEDLTQHPKTSFVKQLVEAGLEK